MKRGDVVFWPKYPFKDRNGNILPSDKMLVAMGCIGDEWLFFRTTSVPREDRPDLDGCHADQSVFRFNVNRNKFEKPCWVQYEVAICRTEQDLKNAGGNYLFSLTPDEIQALINCFKKSPELTTWIWDYCK